MLVYFVQWRADDELTKGKGRITQNEWQYCFSVLCRNSKDATFCMEYLFQHDFKTKFSISDGEITLRRQKIDSRNFDVIISIWMASRSPCVFWILTNR